MLYYISFVLFGIGLYGIISQKNLFKQLVSLTIIDTAVNIFIVSLGYLKGAEAPIYSVITPVANFVDPLPQALVLTAIVIGVGTLALGAMLLVHINEEYGSVDPDEIRAAKEVIE
ncbi:MAG: sodium:proton antiporter [Fervidobacterium sp.]|uniref:Membrane bound protein complex subunit mbxG n=1 Tax=Fervidobacterium gondwanense DSM 13020 TaxID=1121883 RepID=A0A1M7RWH3_FERGO|nr:sodium:proton antiporter [Fervidobacterium gondwanense]UXF00064.1 monovalent cation/H+ antiporter subunit C [Fervidobacterium riparium]SHN50717.1 Membrane bound protein complex subunit mbxG [Fervidobacterium gondwanense DSM 13020]